MGVVDAFFILFYDLCLAFSVNLQVVGLTASIGVGETNAVTDITAKDYILSVCANLDARDISTVEDKDNLKELSNYASRPKQGNLQKIILHKHILNGNRHATFLKWNFVFNAHGILQYIASFI